MDFRRLEGYYFEKRQANTPVSFPEASRHTPATAHDVEPATKAASALSLRAPFSGGVQIAEYFGNELERRQGWDKGERGVLAFGGASYTLGTVGQEISSALPTILWLVHKYLQICMH
ncbi:hypothetical protein NL676_034334 [Syzygium grande]|nr:hypothetical protein NL676_034334 [Syzygium grande]